MASARGKLYGRRGSKRDESNSGSQTRATDEFYSSCLCLRSLPVSVFLQSNYPTGELPITSINEDRLLKELGVSEGERYQIEGLATRSSVSRRKGSGPVLTEEQLLSAAIVRLAALPPPEVRAIQRRTTKWLLRPYPLGLRFSGKNMSPLPCWLGGAHFVALNMSNPDLAVQLHFALFNGSGGFVLKPPEMLAVDADDSADGDDKAFWPPPRERLHRMTMKVVSLHELPKRGEQRPRFEGSRMSCHKYLPELSGEPRAPTSSMDLSSQSVTISLHPIGGFCAVSSVLPLPQAVESEITLAQEDVEGRATGAVFNQQVHCVATEPHATFFRVGVSDGGREVAYEIAVLGRLRYGYRVLQLRGALGTRIELCYLFVRISFGSEPNLWSTPTHARIQNAQHGTEVLRLKELLAEAMRRLSISERSQSVPPPYASAPNPSAVGTEP